MDVSFASAVVILLLVMDPLGNIPLFVAVLREVEQRRRVHVIVRECLIAFAVLLIFVFFGRKILTLLGLSDIALNIAGGVILFLIALRMVFPRPEGVFGAPGAGGEPMLVPLAVPMIAGPSAIATVMLLASRDPAHIVEAAIALTLAMALTTLVLAASFRLQDILGERGMIALERLMGLVLTALAVEMLLTGVRSFVAQLAH
jgi:small neutral amino acid transporter SnatA (MarC family)